MGLVVPGMGLAVPGGYIGVVPGMGLVAAGEEPGIGRVVPAGFVPIGVIDAGTDPGIGIVALGGAEPMGVVDVAGVATAGVGDGSEATAGIAEAAGLLAAGGLLPEEPQPNVAVSDRPVTTHASRFMITPSAQTSRRTGIPAENSLNAC